MIELKAIRKFKKEPYSSFKTVQQVTVMQLKTMYGIYEKYYENTRYDLFEQDFLGKSGVFLIHDPESNAIVGFSTVVERDFLVHDKARHAFFSGDTIIEKKYWGSRALQRCMIRYLIAYKLKHPTKPIYWMLISKGFKTYLLLANNYPTYYPHVDDEHAHLKDMVDAYCAHYYQDYYDAETGLLNFGDDYQPLKESVAPIHTEMRAKNKKIEFFEKCNPTWVQGTELPCIGEMSWKDLYKLMRGFSKKRASKGALEAQRPQPRLAQVTLQNKVA